jgi:GABA(A) receptor-associated protein
MSRPSGGPKLLAPGEAARIMAKYPDKIPVVVEKAQKTRDSLPDLKKWKYVVPRDVTMGQMIYLIRQYLTLPPEEALFLFVENTLVPSNERIVDTWTRYRSDDGALHVLYSGESAFGR